MADHTLSPLTALGGTQARIDTIGGVTITERPDIALASVAVRRGRDEDLAAAAPDLLGTSWPETASSAGTGALRAFWMAPGQWMVEAPFATHEDLAARLKARLGDAASVTEQTDAWVVLDVTGTSVTALFQRLCPLDLEDLPDGAASRTLLHHLGCFVLVRRTGEAVTVLAPRSAADFLHHALLTTAQAIA